METSQKYHDVFIEFYGRKYKTTILAKSRMEATQKALVAAKGKIKVVEDQTDIMSFVDGIFAETMYLLDGVAARNRLMKELETIAEEMQNQELLGITPIQKAHSMKNSMTRLLEVACMSIEMADYMIMKSDQLEL